MADADDARPALDRRRGHSRLVVWWPLLALLVVVLVYGGFVGAVWAIRSDAKKFAVRTTEDYSGDEVEALLALVASEGRSLADRNRAVWALGQLGDERALPVLAKFYTGRLCDHTRFLCQKELRKAIDRCEGKNWAPEWLPFFPRRPRPVHSAGTP